MVNTVLIAVVILAIVAVVLAIKKQARVTRSMTVEEQSQNTRVFEESAKRMELTVAEALSEKARDPRLATMTQEDLAYEVLKECFDPEIPLNIVDLGLIYDVKVNPDNVAVKITMTSPPAVRPEVERNRSATSPPVGKQVGSFGKPPVLARISISSVLVPPTSTPIRRIVSS